MKVPHELSNEWLTNLGILGTSPGLAHKSHITQQHLRMLSDGGAIAMHVGFPARHRARLSERYELSTTEPTLS